MVGPLFIWPLVIRTSTLSHKGCFQTSRNGKMVVPKNGKSANAILDCYDVLAVANQNSILRGHHTCFSRTTFGSKREGS